MLHVAQNEFEVVQNTCSSLGNNSWAGIPCALADLARDKPQEARKRLEALKNIVVNPGRYRRVTAHAWQIDTLVYEGKLVEAARQAEIVSNEAYGQFADEMRYERARLAFFQGNQARAVELASNLLKIADEEEVIRDTTILLARMGHHAEREMINTDKRVDRKSVV